VLRKISRDGNDQDHEMYGVRSVKVKDLHVSWKWPVDKVVTCGINVRSCSQNIRRTGNNVTNREPPVLPVHKGVRPCARGSLPLIEYKRVSWPCVRRGRKLV
jgi:hypothetical protein